MCRMDRKLDNREIGKPSSGFNPGWVGFRGKTDFLLSLYHKKYLF
jgi:hypothetical protein